MGSSFKGQPDVAPEAEQIDGVGQQLGQHRLVEAPVVGVGPAMNQQHRFFCIGVAHQAPADGLPVPGPEVVGRAHALARCASASSRTNCVDDGCYMGPVEMPIANP